MPDARQVSQALLMQTLVAPHLCSNCTLSDLFLVNDIQDIASLLWGGCWKVQRECKGSLVEHCEGKATSVLNNVIIRDAY